METKNISLSIALPYPKFIDQILDFDPKSLSEKFYQFFQTMYTGVQDRTAETRNRFSFSNFSPRFRKKNFFKILLPLVILIIVIGAIAAFLNRPVSTGVGTNVLSAQSNDKVKVKPPLRTLVLNRAFTFPIKDEKGKEVDKFTYIIESAELRDEVVIKGQRASSVEGRTFLILNLKVVNKGKQRIGLNTRDYVRLAVNGKNDELLAPDIHNDPVEIQAISTKYTRLGFPINDTDKKLKVFVGEIEGTKQSIDLTF